jgi:hypothetical protein
MPYLTNVKKNELERLKTMTDEDILDDEDFRAAKGTRAPLLGIREEREWSYSDSNS